MPISVTGTTVTLTATSSAWAIARRQVTTTEPTKQVSLAFSTTRRAVIMRVGSTAGGREIVDDVTLYPGEHLISFTPGVGVFTYYVQFTLKDEGTAQVIGLGVVSPGLMSLPLPYAAADLPTLRFEQSADVTWIFHPAYQTRVLERRGNTSWSLRRFQPIDGPFDTTNTGPITLTANVQTGTATISASGPTFKTSDVGALLRLVHTGQFRTANLGGVGQATATIKVSGVGLDRSVYVSVTGTWAATINVQRSIGNEISWVDVASYTTTTNLSFNDGLDNQIVYYRLRCSAYTSGTAVSSLSYSRGITEGTAIVTAVGADNSVTAEVFTAMGATTATAEWSIGAWSDRFGWPSAGAVHDGRLWVARADRIWGSQSDDYESFLIGVLDSDAISRRMATGDINTARWMEGVGRLLVGTAGAEIENRSNQLEEPMTPSNLVTRGRSTRGSANVQAARIDDNVLFVSKSGRRLYLLSMDSERGGYAPADLTRLHRDVGGEGGFTEIAVQIDPEPRVWCVRADGQMAVLTFSTDEKVYAWQRLVTDGAFESVCIVPGTPEDVVYVVVRRTIGGTTKRYVERFQTERWTDSRQAWRLHSGLKYDGAPVSALTGLEHLEGKSVSIWADGREMAPRVVASGAIALDWPTSVAIVGLAYSGRWKSGKLAYAAQGGSALTQKKMVQRLGALVYRTPGGCVAWGQSFDSLDRLPTHRAGDLTDAPLSLWTADLAMPIEAWSDEDARIVLVMDKPGPAEVLGLVPRVQTNEN